VKNSLKIVNFVMALLLSACVLVSVFAVILVAGEGDFGFKTLPEAAAPPTVEAVQINEAITTTTAVLTTILEPEPEPPEVFSAKLGFVGDLMVHEWQLNDARRRGDGVHNFEHNFEPVLTYLQAPDLMIGNLETTFAGPDIGYTCFPVFNTPDSFGEALKNAGFGLLTTANNHGNDRRENGIIRTLDVLDSLGISAVGTHRTAEDRDSVLIKDINGITFAFLAYSYSTNGIPLTAGKPYLLNLLDEALIERDILYAKTYNPDFIVVMPHMGDEYHSQPRQVWRNWANFMLNAGADVVVAHHPHVFQPMEIVEIEEEDGTVREGFIAFSIGNFISSQRTIPRDAGVILNMEFEKVEGERPFIKSISYIPTWVQFVDKTGQYNIQVVSVYDILKAVENGEEISVRTSDIARIRAVHAEATAMFSGEVIPLEEMQNEYFILRR